MGMRSTNFLPRTEQQGQKSPSNRLSSQSTQMGRARGLCSMNLLYPSSLEEPPP